MTFLNRREKATVEAIADLVWCNPFLHERLEAERRALGPAYGEPDRAAVWHAGPGDEPEQPNLVALAERTEELVETLRGRLVGGAKPTEDERILYGDLVVYRQYYRHEDAFLQLILRSESASGGSSGHRRSPSAKRFEAPFYDTFRDELERCLEPAGIPPTGRFAPPHLFACFFQVRRAFHYTYRHILGRSLPAAVLRARVWESIFTHDMRRFQRSLFRRLGDITTLVTGPSGTGKELVARAIGLGRYVPFNPSTGAFEGDYQESFFPLNLSALSPTLIESELFGHKRGTFTGAIADRTGWLEICPALGTVFLDEIGEVDLAIQVKLLRVLESRTFQRLGETGGDQGSRRFQGKAIAATNRDLAEEMRHGRFRADLYYRLCSDTIETPSLAARLADDPEEIGDLLTTLARRLVDNTEADNIAAEARDWIEQNLGSSYPWPGNVRELSQCLRNVMIRRDYRPATEGSPPDPTQALAQAVIQGTLTADELLNRYCTLVYRQAGTYQEAARRLALDRRTVKSRVDRDRSIGE
ncbi:MAG: sigma 54-interacting transcriptional regulator [Acidobacteriota bacterium]